MPFEKLDNEGVIKVVMDSTVKKSNEPTFVKIKNIRFKNGTSVERSDIGGFRADHRKSRFAKLLLKRMGFVALSGG